MRDGGAYGSAVPRAYANLNPGLSIQLNSTSTYLHVHSVNNCHISMNVVIQLTQFVGRGVINKNTTDLLRADWLYAVQLGQLS